LVKRRQAELDLFNSPDVKKADADDKVTAIVNGNQIKGAVLKDGTVLIPLRAAGDNIPGSRIGWDQVTKTATLDTP
ncbi:hypothetical protein ACTHQ2_22165, partial [Bacillus subtilis]